MCRSIKVLRKTDLIVTPQDVSAAALSVRSQGEAAFIKPSKANQAVFDEAVQEIAHATTKLLDRLERNHNPSFTTNAFNESIASADGLTKRADQWRCPF